MDGWAPTPGSRCAWRTGRASPASSRPASTTELAPGWPSRRRRPRRGTARLATPARRGSSSRGRRSRCSPIPLRGRRRARRARPASCCLHPVTAHPRRCWQHRPRPVDPCPTTRRRWSTPLRDLRVRGRAARAVEPTRAEPRDRRRPLPAAPPRAPGAATDAADGQDRPGYHTEIDHFTRGRRRPRAARAPRRSSRRCCAPACWSRSRASASGTSPSTSRSCPEIHALIERGETADPQLAACGPPRRRASEPGRAVDRRRAVVAGARSSAAPSGHGDRHRPGRSADSVTSSRAGEAESPSGARSPRRCPASRATPVSSSASVEPDLALGRPAGRAAGGRARGAHRRASEAPRA